jgi:FkbM family methyltransferase
VQAVRPEQPRIDLTTSCRDADDIPKVPEAGQVVEQDAQRVQVMHNGVKIVEGCYYGDWMTEIIRELRGHHEPQEELAFHLVVERLVEDTDTPVMLELGAFWAYYSLWLLERSSEARTFMVEPDPNNLDAGRRNFELNGREGVFLNAAIGRSAEPAAPFVCESDGRTHQVPSEGLGSLLDRFGLIHVDLLLVDVQGAETALLDGASELLADGAVRFVVVSTHHHSISGDPLTHRRCLDLITGLGAHVIAEHTVAESFSGDGLIAASFDPRDRDLAAPISYARASESLFGDPLLALAESERSRATLQDDLTVARRRIDEAQRELAAIRSTASWRLRERMLRMPGAHRAVGAVRRTAGRADP